MNTTPEYLAAELIAIRAERDELKEFLRTIRDMPESGRDDSTRLRNLAGVALGKSDTEIECK